MAGNLSRTALARQLCEHSHWVNQQGQPCLGQARKILKKLAEALGKVSVEPVLREEVRWWNAMMDS